MSCDDKWNLEGDSDFPGNDAEMEAGLDPQEAEELAKEQAKLREFQEAEMAAPSKADKDDLSFVAEQGIQNAQAGRHVQNQEDNFFAGSVEAGAEDSFSDDSVLADEIEKMHGSEVSALQEENQQLKGELSELKEEVSRRKADLYNLQQEYNAYVKRAKADLSNQLTVAATGVVESLLPVLDEIALARQHGDLTEGPFKTIAEKIETILASKYQVERFGEVGEEFDPNFHEALMASEDSQVSVPTIKQVIQPGYRIGDKVVRAARVMVANPA